MAPIILEAVSAIEIIPIKFRKESQHQHLNRLFFLKSRPIHFFHSNCVVRPVKQGQLNFYSIEINKPLPTLVHNVL